MSVKVYSDILFGRELKKLSNLLKEALLTGLFAGSHNYRPDPFKAEFRASQTPYCSRNLVFSNVLDFRSKSKGIDTLSSFKEKADSGTLIHHIKQSLLAKSSLSVVNESEMKIVTKDIAIFGHMDIMLLDYGDYLICIDIKTKDDFGYLDYYFQASPELIKEKNLNNPISHNKIQLNVYQHYLIKKYPDKIVLGYFWYILRLYSNEQLIHMLNPKNWRLFFVNYDPDSWDNTHEKLCNISNCLKNGLLPAFDNEKWECANKTAICPYLHLCFSEDQKIATVQELMELKGENQ